MMWHQVRLNKPGLDGVLGSLERQIMAQVWAIGEASVSDVHERLDTDHAYDTIKTVMARLCEKGLLARTLDKRAYQYRALISREELESQVSRQMVDSLLTGFGSTAISQFADVLREKPEQLAELRELLNKMAAEPE